MSRACRYNNGRMKLQEEVIRFSPYKAECY